MTRIALNLAASTFVLGATTMGCMMNGIGTGAAVASTAQSRTDQQAAQLFEQASRSISEGNLEAAVAKLEQAVALAPRDAGYRLLLADAYMKSGRFQSAQTAYGDVLSLDPGRTRAALSHALMRAANGDSHGALAQLERLEGQASPADLGLAYALAGSPQRAVDILEPAARAMGATARVRQNLALAYAFGGDWQRARTIAAQDVSPAELGNRMAQWASLAQRSGSPDQVAAMIGVNPVRDPGQPVQLALSTPARIPAPVEAPAPVVAFAAAAPEPVQVPMPTDAPAVPVAYAAADAPAPILNPSTSAAPRAADAELETAEWGVAQNGAVQLPEPVPASEQVPVRVQFAAAAEALVRPDPVVMPVASKAVRTVRAARVASAATPATVPAKERRSSSGRYVVQIGAFSSAANAERAWQQAETRFGLRAEQPVTMTVDMSGRLLHRVAVSGFDKRGQATQLCRSIQARGGECFVRSNAGDAAINWAARYTSRG